MGSLSNLYISQSYQSLIHLATNNTASANLIELQDGLGNSIGVAVNTSGDLFLSGSLTASLQQGYLYVGNASGKTTAFPTSSLVTNINTGSLVTTSSFNSYTQSTNIRLNNLETTSASVNISISNLNTTTASQAISITNLNTNSASVNTSITNINSATASLFTSTSLSLTTASFSGNTLTFTKGDASTFGVVIPDISGSTINTGSFATTGSNSFNGDQEITGSFKVTYVGNTGNPTIEANSTQVRIFNPSASPLEIGNLTGDVYITAGGGNPYKDLQLLAGLLQPSSSTYQSQNFLQTTKIYGSLTASLQEGYAWVGGVGDVSKLVATSSFGGALPAGTISGSSQITALGFVSSSITASSLVTASFSGNTLTFTKGDTTTFGIVLPDVSGSTINTGSFATTGSNTFYGNQKLDGKLTISGSDSNQIFFERQGGGDILRLGVSQNGQTFELGLTGSVNKTMWLIDNQGGTRINTFDAPIIATNYLIVQGALTASLQQGYAWVGNSSNVSTLVATSSFGGTTNTGSLMLTGSIAGNILTFTKGDASTFSLTIPSATGSVFDTGSFATTGSNTFRGDQIVNGKLTISSSANSYLQFTSPNNQTGSGQIFFGSLGPYIQTYSDSLPDNQGLQLVAGISGSFALATRYGGGGAKIDLDAMADQTNPAGARGRIQVKSNGQIDLTGLGGGITISGSGTNIQGLTYPTADGTNGQVLTTNGSGTLTFTTAAGGGTAFSNPNLVSNSGSLFIVGNTFNSASANLSHISASAQNQANLVFKNNNNTGDTILSGSNNIFTNPTAPTAGFKRYIGGSNNLYLHSTNGVNTQITASAASVSGNRPTMNNNIFVGDYGEFKMNQAVNTGTHAYYGNIGEFDLLVNAMAFTGSLTFENNIGAFGLVRINAASASNAEIASGLSGSHTIYVASNYIAGGTITLTTNRNQPPNTQPSIYNNVLAGGNISLTNHSSSAAVNAQNNIAIGTMQYSNVGAAALGVLHRTSGNINTSYGAINLVASASAINSNTNIIPTTMTVTNRAWSGSVGSGSLTFATNLVMGSANAYTISGSNTGTTAAISAASNAILGRNNTIFTDTTNRGNYIAFNSNVIGGGFLIMTGSNNNVSSEVGGAHFGRYNANDGRRNTTGENIFSVGTGTSTTRKTGFLIDSGSNTYVEGTFNVSGSTAFTGSVKVASTFQLQLPTGSNQQAGTAVLDGASPSLIVVSNSLVSANSIIMVSKQTLTNAHSPAVSSIGAGTFTITSTGNGDTDTVGWFIINNS